MEERINADYRGFIKFFADEKIENIEHVLVKFGCRAKIFHTAEEVGEWVKEEISSMMQRKTAQPTVDSMEMEELRPTITAESPD